MQWFYVQDGQKCGPVPRTELDELVKSGALSPTTLVWNESMPDWKTYEEAPSSSTPTTQNGMAHCAECGDWHPETEVTRIGSRTVCSGCQPKFSSKLGNGSQAAGTRVAGRPQHKDFDKATLGMILSIVGLVSCGLVAILGLILSIRGLGEAKEKQNEASQKFAIAGIIIAIFTLALHFGVAIFKILNIF